MVHIIGLISTVTVSSQAVVVDLTSSGVECGEDGDLRVDFDYLVYMRPDINDCHHIRAKETLMDKNTVSSLGSCLLQ